MAYRHPAPRENDNENGKRVPDQAAKNNSKKTRFTYRPQYALIVPCDDQAHQKRLYKSLTKSGLRVKVVAV